MIDQKKRRIEILTTRILKEHREYAHCTDVSPLPDRDEWAKIAATKILAYFETWIEKKDVIFNEADE